MNFIARAKLPARRSFLDLLSLSAHQQCDFYSTRAARSNQKLEQITKPGPQKASQASSSFSKETDELVWPKPKEIMFQAKVANFVNLIGHVGTPVRFETSSDGKHLAITVLFLGNEGGNSPICIPVVFEGDLAHVVACHVKKGDWVFVSGQLSVDTVGIGKSESFSKFHVSAENLNFVERSNKFVGKKVATPLLDAEFEAGEQETVKSNEIVETTTELEKDKAKAGKDVGKKMGAEETSNLWRDLVKNPSDWSDYRSQKSNGSVKSKFPDFKRKVTGEALWVNSAPHWVLPGIGSLEFTAQGTQQKPVERPAKDSWKTLIETPEKWWDNRANKRNPKSPDFKHKETGEGVWLNGIPGWAVAKLPPLKQ